MRLPANSIEGQSRCNSFSAGSRRAQGLGIYKRAVFGIDNNVAHTGNHAAVCDGGIGTGKHQVGGYGTVYRQGGAATIGAAATGGYSTIYHGLDAGVFQGGYSHRIGRYRGIIDVGRHITAHIVTHHQPADGDGIRIGNIDSLGNQFSSRCLLPITDITVICFTEIDASIYTQVFINTSGIAAYGMIVGKPYPVPEGDGLDSVATKPVGLFKILQGLVEYADATVIGGRGGRYKFGISVDTGVILGFDGGCTTYRDRARCPGEVNISLRPTTDHIAGKQAAGGHSRSAKKGRSS